MEELNDLIPENKSKFSGVPENEDPLKEIKKRFSRQTKIYPPTEWWNRIREFEILKSNLET